MTKKQFIAALLAIDAVPILILVWKTLHR